MEVIRTGKNEETLLSLSETAHMLNVSERTIHRWIQDGRLPAYKPGRAYRFRTSDIEAFLEERRGVPLAEREPSWETAVTNAHAVREDGQARMEELLSAWRASRERQADPDERGGYLDEMGSILQAAYDTETALVKALSGPRIVDQWPEVQAADRYYVHLCDLLQAAGLIIRRSPAHAAEQVQWEGRPYSVEEDQAA